MEANEIASLVLDHDEVEAGHLILHEVADIAVSSLVGDEEPALREYRASFQLIDGLGVVEVGG